MSLTDVDEKGDGAAVRGENIRLERDQLRDVIKREIRRKIVKTARQEPSKSNFVSAHRMDRDTYSFQLAADQVIDRYLLSGLEESVDFKNVSGTPLQMRVEVTDNGDNINLLVRKQDQEANEDFLLVTLQTGQFPLKAGAPWHRLCKGDLPPSAMFRNYPKGTREYIHICQGLKNVTLKSQEAQSLFDNLWTPEEEKIPSLKKLLDHCNERKRFLESIFTTFGDGEGKEIENFDKKIACLEAFQKIQKKYVENQGGTKAMLNKAVVSKMSSAGRMMASPPDGRFADRFVFVEQLGKHCENFCEQKKPQYAFFRDGNVAEAFKKAVLEGFSQIADQEKQEEVTVSFTIQRRLKEDIQAEVRVQLQKDGKGGKMLFFEVRPEQMIVHKKDRKKDGWPTVYRVNKKQSENQWMVACAVPWKGVPSPFKKQLTEDAEEFLRKVEVSLSEPSREGQFVTDTSGELLRNIDQHLQKAGEDPHSAAYHLSEGLESLRKLAVLRSRTTNSASGQKLKASYDNMKNQLESACQNNRTWTAKDADCLALPNLNRARGIIRKKTVEKLFKIIANECVMSFVKPKVLGSKDVETMLKHIEDCASDKYEQLMRQPKLQKLLAIREYKKECLDVAANVEMAFDEIIKDRDRVCGYDAHLEDIREKSEIESIQQDRTKVQEKIDKNLAIAKKESEHLLRFASAQEGNEAFMGIAPQTFAASRRVFESKKIVTEAQNWVDSKKTPNVMAQSLVGGFTGALGEDKRSYLSEVDTRMAAACCELLIRVKDPENEEIYKALLQLLDQYAKAVNGVHNDLKLCYKTDPPAIVSTDIRGRAKTFHGEVVNLYKDVSAMKDMVEKTYRDEVDGGELFKAGIDRSLILFEKAVLRAKSGMDELFKLQGEPSAVPQHPEQQGADAQPRAPVVEKRKRLFPEERKIAAIKMQEQRKEEAFQKNIQTLWTLRGGERLTVDDERKLEKKSKKLSLKGNIEKTRMSKPKIATASAIKLVQDVLMECINRAKEGKMINIEGKEDPVNPLVFMKQFSEHSWYKSIVNKYSEATQKLKTIVWALTADEALQELGNTCIEGWSGNIMEIKKTRAGRKVSPPEAGMYLNVLQRFGSDELSAKASFFLGKAFIKGARQPNLWIKDIFDALDMFESAAEKGSAEAVDYLNDLAKEGFHDETGITLPEETTSVKSYIPGLIGLRIVGHSAGQDKALSDEKFKRLKKGFNQSFNLLKKAADNGNHVATQELKEYQNSKLFRSLLINFIRGDPLHD